MMPVRIVKMTVNAISVEEATNQIQAWLSDNKGRYVCVSNVHMCMEVLDKSATEIAVNSADLTVADGKPIYIAQKMLGCKNAQHVRGEDLTLSLCKRIEKTSFSIGFFGATKELLVQLEANLKSTFPSLNITYTFAPPFRNITKEEDVGYVRAINASGVSILFVGLGCPKQEIWMADHRDRLSCVMVGIGAVFDFISGNKKCAPRWMQKVGFEWSYRLASEPERLFKRYLKHNPRFIWYFTQQLLGRSNFD